MYVHVVYDTDRKCLIIGDHRKMPSMIELAKNFIQTIVHNSLHSIADSCTKGNLIVHRKGNCEVN